MFNKYVKYVNVQNHCFKENFLEFILELVILFNPFFEQLKTIFNLILGENPLNLNTEFSLAEIKSKSDVSDWATHVAMLRYKSASNVDKR